MSDLMEQLVEQVRDIVEDLEPGARVIIHTTEPCGCQHYGGEKVSKFQTTSCHICNDKGFIFDAQTFLPKGAY